MAANHPEMDPPFYKIAFLLLYIPSILLNL